MVRSQPLVSTAASTLYGPQASEAAITSPANNPAVTAFLFTATAQRLQSVSCNLYAACNPHLQGGFLTASSRSIAPAASFPRISLHTRTLNGMSSILPFSPPGRLSNPVFHRQQMA
ncbi:hypothetical protein K456DRAFT_346377 [Colletotrichum gloeosporioides 23]|nr:hypothetical protein K456DRAFT_346377 [Colletotrichum gloeosporioides 23]